jgi:dynein heavy chain
MNGTCKEAEPVVQHEDEEPIIFSFFSDVSANPHVLRMQMMLQQAIKRVFGKVNTHLEGWRRYDTVHQLWNQKKRAALEKLVDRSPPTAYFDIRLSQYLKLSHAVQAQPETTDVHFLRVDVVAVMVGINTVANEWLIDYGHVLHTLGTRNLERLTDIMDKLLEDLNTVPEDLVSLKFILQTCHSFGEQNMQMELDMNDCVEQVQYHTRYTLYPIHHTHYTHYTHYTLYTIHHTHYTHYTHYTLYTKHHTHYTLCRAVPYPAPVRHRGRARGAVDRRWYRGPVEAADR